MYDCFVFCIINHLKHVAGICIWRLHLCTEKRLSSWNASHAIFVSTIRMFTALRSILVTILSIVNAIYDYCLKRLCNAAAKYVRN